ncbi:MAG TPA: hypothetical protein VGJ97_09565 [Anaerolineaceae bacterium]
MDLQVVSIDRRYSGYATIAHTRRVMSAGYAGPLHEIEDDFNSIRVAWDGWTNPQDAHRLDEM